MNVMDRWMWLYILVTSQDYEEMNYVYQLLTRKNKQGKAKILQLIEKQESPDFRKRKKK